METSEMTPPLTNEQLDELLGMEKRATAGPWEEFLDRNNKNYSYIVKRNKNGELTHYVCEHPLDGDGILIAASRNAIRQLVEEVKASRGEIAKLQKHIDNFSCCCSGCTKHNAI